MDNLTSICCNTVIQNRIYYHNIIPVKLEERLDQLKRRFYPDEFFEEDDEVYYDEYDNKFHVPEKYYISFSKSSNIKITYNTIFFVFKKDGKNRYIKTRVIHDKKILRDFKKSISNNIGNYLIFGKDEYPVYNKKYLLLDYF